MIPQEQLDLWKKLCEEATPGPWILGRGTTQFEDGDGFYRTISDSTADSKFISEARTALPLLIAENERLREALSYYAKMKVVCSHDDSSWCDHCPDAGRIARKVLGIEND